MKNIFLLAAFALSSLGLLQAQSYDLEGELSIYLKNGEVLTGKYRIWVWGSKIKTPDNISYQDIDSIKQGQELYEFVKISKNHVSLLKVDGIILKDSNLKPTRLKSDKVTFYQGRLLGGGGVNSLGGINPWRIVPLYYMLKEGMDYAVNFSTRKFDNLVKKYFSDCPALMEALKDRKKRKNITTYTIFEIYTNGCIDKYDLLNLK